jgi:RNA polymerase sigma factor (sigma-70 family)
MSQQMNAWPPAVNTPDSLDDSLCDTAEEESLTLSLADLYRKYARELWAKLYGVCGDPERAHDAVQEAFLRLQAYREQRVYNPEIWLLHVGRNWLRDFSRRRAHGEVPTATAGEHLVCPNDAPDHSLERRETQQLIRKALGELKLADREVLVLRYGLGWSAQQIALSLDARPSAIDMRLSRARVRLAAILEASARRSTIAAGNSETQRETIGNQQDDCPSVLAGNRG